MEASLEQLILTELQETRNDLKEFRAEVAIWREETARQLSEHDTKITDLSGNGQPGRMADAEGEISSLKRTKYWLIGWSSGVAGVVAAAFELARLLTH